MHERRSLPRTTVHATRFARCAARAAACFLLTLFAAEGAPVPCASLAPHLSDYIAAGSCTAHGITFSDWFYDDGGAPFITADKILVGPSVVSPIFEYHVEVPFGWAAAPGVTLTPVIGATATGAGAAVAGHTFLGFGGAGGGGVAGGTLKLCQGDSYLFGCLFGTEMTLTVLTPGPLLAEGPLGGSFSTIGMRLEMTVSGGAGGAFIETINGGLIVPVPEPSTWLLLGGGLLVPLLRRSR